MLSDQASKNLEGIEALGTFVQKQNQENTNRVREIEREADELRRILVEELHQTFVTPMDREDIFALSRAIDDIVDYANSTVDEMEHLWGIFRWIFTGNGGDFDKSCPWNFRCR